MCGKANIFNRKTNRGSGKPIFSIENQYMLGQTNIFNRKTNNHKLLKKQNPGRIVGMIPGEDSRERKVAVSDQARNCSLDLAGPSMCFSTEAIDFP